MLDDKRNRTMMMIHILVNDRSQALPLEEVLRIAKIELEINRSLPIETKSRRFDLPEYHTSLMLEARLFDHFPFSQLQEGVVWCSTGCSGPQRATALQWVARQLIADVAAASIIEAAEKQYAENGYDALEITKVTGVEVEDIVKITEDYELWPHSKLPSDFRNQLLFGDVGAPFVSVSTCALVHRFRHEKAIDPDYNGPTVDWTKDRFVVSNKSRAEKRLNIQRAMILSGDGPVGMPSTYCRAATDNLLDVDRQYSGIFDATGLRSIKPNIEAIRKNLRLLESFNRPGALCVAIDRLGKARSWQSNVDKALDFGMALEIVLMHENGNNNDGNGEITYKVSLRAACLVGSQQADRNEIFEKTKKLYGHRSAAAHSGRLKKENEFMPDEVNAFVTNVLSEILQRGDFPSWRDLVLGIEPAPERPRL